MENLLNDSTPLLHHIYSTLLRTTPYLRALESHVLRAASLYYTYIYPLLYPFYNLSVALLRRTVLPAFDQLARSLTSSSSPQAASSSSSSSSATLSLASLLVLALTLLLTLKALDMMRRTVIFWISVALRLLFWGVLAFLGMYVYARGIEDTVRDVGYVVGVLQGLEEVGERRGAVRGWRKEEQARVVRQRGW